MTKREQLTELIGYFAHGNKSEFGRLLDMSPSCVTAWLRRDTFDAGLVSLKLPQVSREWLLTGKGAMLTDTAAPLRLQAEPPALHLQQPLRPNRLRQPHSLPVLLLVRPRPFGDKIKA